MQFFDEDHPGGCQCKPCIKKRKATLGGDVELSEFGPFPTSETGLEFLGLEVHDPDRDAEEDRITLAVERVEGSLGVGVDPAPILVADCIRAAFWEAWQMGFEAGAGPLAYGDQIEDDWVASDANARLDEKK